MRNERYFASVLVLAVSFGSPWALATSFAQGGAEATPTAPPEAAAESESAGLLPVPDYSGDLGTRKALTGDWSGVRAELAKQGITFELDWNQYAQRVTTGGREVDGEYGGKGEYLMYLDLMRMGVMPGALIKFRAESRYGSSVNGASGTILPVNTDAYFPLTGELDEDVGFAITDLVYTQFLSEHVGLFLGKIDTLDGDSNEFASGRGTTQFMNANFVFNSTLALRLPYSTLGAGAVWIPSSHLTLTTSVMNTTEASTTSGFDDFGKGASSCTEADFQYRWGDLPGGQNVGFLYSFDQDFTDLGGQFLFEPGQGIVAPTTSSTWAAYWSAWQYLWSDDPSSEPVQLGDGRADRRGFGPFARFGIADQDTNPVDWSASGGLGGRGLIPSREDDGFGLGYYYSSLQTARLSGILALADHSQGFEAFYDIAFTPAAHLTLDLQVVDAPSERLDSAVIGGLRLGLSF